MTVLTPAEALAEIEALIEARRENRMRPGPGQRTYHALKMAADELRAAAATDATGEAVRTLGRSVAFLERSKRDRGHYSEGCLRDVALQVRARWPVIRQALAFFEDARKVDAAE